MYRECVYETYEMRKTSREVQTKTEFERECRRASESDRETKQVLSACISYVYLSPTTKK